MTDRSIPQPECARPPAAAGGAAGLGPARPGLAPGRAAGGVARAAPSSGRGLAAPLLRLYPALGVSSYRLLWVGMLPSTIAWQMGVVATGYAALTLSGSATTLGLVTSSYGLPMLVLSLVGGVVADRLPRRSVLFFTQSALGLTAAALAALALSGALQVWHLFVAGLVQGIAFAFNMPARQAYVADLVGRELVRNAAALNNAGVNFSRIAGPALGGALLAVPAIGVPGVFVLMTALYGLVLLTLARLPHLVTRRAEPRATGAAGGWAELVEGLAYVRASPTLLTLLALATATVLLGMPYQQLMPLFAERVFAVGAAGLGTLLAASGLGALVGALVAAALASTSRPAALRLLLGAGFGLALAGFALAPSFPVAVGLLLLVGFSWAAYTALNSTLIIANTSPRLYGRVMSLYLLTFAVSPFGTLPMAWLADQVGGQPTIAAAGALIALLLVAVAALYPPYRRIR